MCKCVMRIAVRVSVCLCVSEYLCVYEGLSLCVYVHVRVRPAHTIVRLVHYVCVFLNVLASHSSKYTIDRVVVLY